MNEEVKVNVLHFARGTRDSGVAPSAELETITAKALREEVFDPIRWVIPNLLPAGSTLLAGDPKTGKSWMLLDWCASVAYGGAVLGAYRVDPGHALYLGLEDNKRRLRSRLDKILDGGPTPPFLHVATVAERLDTGFVPNLQRWLENHKGTRLVVIDTLARVRAPSGKNVNTYEQDYKVGSVLTRLAADHNCAIVAVHHTNCSANENYLSRISGTNGLIGSFDNGFVLSRKHGEATAKLHVAGRDIEDDRDIDLEWNGQQGRWTEVTWDKSAPQGSDKHRLFDTLKRLSPALPADLMKQSGLPRDVCITLVAEMREEGVVVVEDGKIRVNA